MCYIRVIPSLDYGSFNESNRLKVVKLFLIYAFNGMFFTMCLIMPQFNWTCLSVPNHVIKSKHFLSVGQWVRFSMKSLSKVCRTLTV